LTRSCWSGWPRPTPCRTEMNKLFALVVSTVGGAVGWWLGSLVGGIMTAFFLSILGTALGVYYGVKLAKTWFRISGGLPLTPNPRRPRQRCFSPLDTLSYALSSGPLSE